MNKLILFAAALLTAGSAMAGDGTITFKTVNNEKDMLFYASKARPDSQKIVTDLIIIPQIAAIPEMVAEDKEGKNASCPEYYVECTATKNDFKKGDPNAKKEGFATRTELPAGAKVNELILPGTRLGGNTDTMTVAAYLKNLPDTTTEPPYRQWYTDQIDSLLNNPSDGFIQYSDKKLTKFYSAAPNILFNVPFIKPYEYKGNALEVMIYLATENKDIYKNLAFSFPRLEAELFRATIYHAHRISFQNSHSWVNLENDTPLFDWELKEGEPLDIAVKYLNLTKNTLPAFQLNFYTNDIRGTVKNTEGAIANQKVTLYSIGDGGNKTEIGSTTTDNTGKFEFLNLDYTANYTLALENQTIEETTLNFGQNAIDNDIEAEIMLQPVTSVNEINNAKTTNSIKYFNMQGIESDKAFDGVNIVVTTYNDGSKEITKQIQ